jgi:REP element-mobilizing transposase RayT
MLIYVDIPRWCVQDGGMNARRILVPVGTDGLYHVVSRVVDRRMALGEAEKRQFLKWAVAYAAFGGLELVAWCLMDNHFHLLVRVPAEDSANLPEAVILARMERIYRREEMREIKRMLALQGGAEARRAWLGRWTRRMAALAPFMKALKQRFTQWFNRTQRRRGTLWEERYRSVVVEGLDGDEGLGHAARVVAAYIDLNPVRAGAVEDPKDWQWSGYGAALRGDKVALRGLRSLWGVKRKRNEVLAAHRLFLYDEGSEERVPEAGEKAKRFGIDVRKVWEERERGGRLPLAVMLRMRVRYLTDGAVVGSRGFVERVTGATGTAKPGRLMRFGDWGPLHALRALRVRLVG